jgi:Pyruvate/2-oxoacid:ferredoxin oxidoreductase gamma subunit
VHRDAEDEEEAARKAVAAEEAASGRRTAMKFDIVLAGVGGQGVLSVVGHHRGGALREGLHVKQSEVHGMSQRGGAVLAHLRLSDRPDRQRPDPARAAR